MGGFLPGCSLAGWPLLAAASYPVFRPSGSVSTAIMHPCFDQLKQQALAGSCWGVTVGWTAFADVASDHFEGTCRAWLAHLVNLQDLGMPR